MSLVATPLQQILTFEQGGEEYALPLLRVREIVEYVEPSRLPATPSYVLGVIELRGSVVPVFDLAAKLGLGRGVVGARSCIVLVETALGPTGDALVGVLVDAVRGVLELTAEEQAEIDAASEVERSKSWHELERSGGTIWLLDVEGALKEGDVPEGAGALTRGEAGADDGARAAEDR